MSEARQCDNDHPDTWLEQILECVRDGKPVRRDLPSGGRLHIDRPLPFLCVHIGDGEAERVARDVTQANASYLTAPSLDQALLVIKALADVLTQKFGTFLLLVIGELSQDRFLTDDAPFLPPFEIAIRSSQDAVAAAARYSKAITAKAVRFRTPRIEQLVAESTDEETRTAEQIGCATLTVRFAPVYRQPQSKDVYPELRDRLVAMLFDAGLQAIATFTEVHETLKLTNHRSLGRKAFVDAVLRVDRAIDDVASTFDFLLAVTPINADAAFEQFRTEGYSRQPNFLYRPLTLQVETVKRQLFSISFDHLEDPVLYDLYREKQQELDVQLSLLASRQTRTFIEFGRALYGPVERPLLNEAQAILADLADSRAVGADDNRGNADSYFVEAQAEAMIAAYRDQHEEFDVSIELRDDLPSGLMVSGNRLLISRSTEMDKQRVTPLLSHEVGVHLLTYFNGSAQGLRLFRTGLSGYEGMQEGLAVFAEYLAGGMTVDRLKLLAARVVGCAAMLDGADFSETYDLLIKQHRFSEAAAFNLALRLYRGGGLAKDAIYLRGLLELLSHLQHGGALEPFWMGKIAASHFGVMQELADRGLLRLPAIKPLFLQNNDGRGRFEKARRGMRPVDMIQQKEI